jgi:hypothetical protein
VTTAVMLHEGWWINADRLALASSAVPKKTIRSGGMSIRQKEKSAAQKEIISTRRRRVRPGSTQKAALPGGRTRRRRRRGHRRAGHCPFGERIAAAGAKKLVKFAGGQNEQQFFAHGLGAFALRAIQLAGGEGSKLRGHGRS